MASFARSLFTQLPTTRASRVLASEGVRRVLDTDRNGSYSQTGEDLVLRAMLGGISRGIYVDVGCFHPIRMSNTYSLYLRGWRGLVIDANDEFAAAFRRERPRDLFIHACVSDTSDPIDFTVYHDRALSSASSKKLFDSESQYKVDRVVSVVPQKLSQILDTHSIDRLDVLSVDAEGYDLNVLRSVDWSRHRPSVIVVEAHGFNPLAALNHPIVSYLIGKRFSLHAFQGNNLFFLSEPS